MPDPFDRFNYADRSDRGGRDVFQRLGKAIDGIASAGNDVDYFHGDDAFGSEMIWTMPASELAGD